MTKCPTLGWYWDSLAVSGSLTPGQVVKSDSWRVDLHCPPGWAWPAWPQGRPGPDL